MRYIFILTSLVFLFSLQPKASNAQGISIGGGLVSGPSIDQMTPKKRRELKRKHRKMSKIFGKMEEFLVNLQSCLPHRYSARNPYNEDIKESYTIYGWQEDRTCRVEREKKYPVGDPLELTCNFTKECIDIIADDRTINDLRLRKYGSIKIRDLMHEIDIGENVKKCFDVLCKKKKED